MRSLGLNKTLLLTLSKVSSSPAVLGIDHRPDNSSSIRRPLACSRTGRPATIAYELNNRPCPYCPLPYPAFFPRPRTTGFSILPCHPTIRSYLEFDITLFGRLFALSGTRPPSVTINTPNARGEGGRQVWTRIASQVRARRQQLTAKHELQPHSQGPHHHGEHQCDFGAVSVI